MTSAMAVQCSNQLISSFDFKHRTSYNISFKKRYSLHTPRLFLLSKDTSELSNDSDYDEELEKAPFEEIAKKPTRVITFQEQECQASSGEENDHAVAGTLEAVSVHDVAHQRVQVVYLTDRATDRVIGTSKERKEIMDQPKEEYEASLEEDEEDKKKELEKEKNVQREALRRSRQNCVLNEPDMKEPRVTISVHHPILGVIKRAFPPYCKIMAVYDWVGSRSTHLEYFAPCFSPQSILYPEQDIALVASSLLCIEPQDFPNPLCRDGDELSIFSALSENSRDDTLIDHDLTTRTDNPNDSAPKDSNEAFEGAVSSSSSAFRRRS